MANTPNYNLSIYPASDITTKFIAFRTDTSGTQATSNFMIIDTAMKDIQDQVTDLQNTPGLTQISATGTNTYIATMTGFGYLEGQSIILSVNNANTGSSTLNINSLGARPLMKYKADGTLAQLSSGDLRANNLYLFTNKGSNWVLVGYCNAEQINIAGTTGNLKVTRIGGNSVQEAGENMPSPEHPSEIESVGDGGAIDIMVNGSKAVSIPIDQPLRALRDADGNITAQDYIDIEAGEIVREVGAVEVDGTENWAVAGASSTDYIAAYIVIPGKKAGMMNLMSSHFQIKEMGVTNPQSNFMRGANSSSAVYLSIAKAALDEWDESFSDAEKAALIKAWLAAQKAAGTPVKVQYGLAEPTRTPIEASGIFETKQGTNTVETDGVKGTLSVQVGNTTYSGETVTFDVNGTVGNMVGISSNNTLIDSGLAQSAIEVKVNTDYTAYEAIAAKEIVGLGTDNKWHKVKSGSSFPIGTIYGVAESAVAANAIVRVIMTGATNPLWTGYTTSTLDTNTKIFIKGEITDGQFLPTNVATTVMEPDASYLAIGYYVSATVTKLDATHMIYTLNTDGNVNAIDGVALGGASGGSGSTQVFSIGNGTDTEFTLNHGANTTFVQLLVRTTATPQTYLVPDWQIVDNDNVKLLFSDAPATNEYQAVLFVFNPSTKVTKYEETIGNGTDTTFYIEHNLGVNYPTVKLIQLTDEALVFPSIQYVDSGGNPSQNTLKLGFYSAPATNSLKVVVESDIVQTEGAQLLGGLTLNEIKEMILQAENPIGKIRLSVENVNPSTHLGFGTWERWGQGRVPVGVATSGTFNTVEKTGGEETHILKTSELPAHAHTYPVNSPGSGAQYGPNNTVSQTNSVKSSTNEAGDGEAHNNLQPYITCYMWKRTA